MSLDDSYLQYPERHYGMDHKRYDWSLLSERKPVVWPGDKKLALWVNINLQFFPLNQAKTAVPVPGGMKMPYPDLRHFSLRDYGNRVGIYRLFKTLDKFNIKPTVAINGALVDRAPYLMDMVAERGDEVIGHGWQADQLHTGSLEASKENQWIEQSLATLRERFQQPVAGWLSPGRLETANTPDLLANKGIQYLCDWVNDDMPYAFNTDQGTLTAMPLSNELDDFFILGSNLHSEDSYAEQIIDAGEFLIKEAALQGGRMLALNLHPWLVGQPHRIGCLERALAAIVSSADVWRAPASEIQQQWSRQQAAD